MYYYIYIFRQLYHHGDTMNVSMCIKNNSSKTVKKIVVSVVQCVGRKNHTILILLPILAHTQSDKTSLKNEFLAGKQENSNGCGS